MIRKVELTVILFILWLILSGKYEPFLIILGVLSSICVAWIAHRMELADPEGFPIQLGPKAIIYWPWLIWEIVKANIDVALIIIKPKLEIQPIIFTTDASQKTDVGIVTYANSITLTPGTITVAVHSNTLEVHSLTLNAAGDVTSGNMNKRVCEMEGKS
jgi:multicomponent Na+:H+ antiporter subunit E